jgi:D-amino-acid dehydrogenase
VAATGAWTNAFLKPAGLTLSVTAQRGQIVHIGLGMTDTSRWPAILPGGTGHYMLAFDDSRIVAGATRETGSGFDYRVTPGGLAEVLEQALAVAPGLAAAPTWRRGSASGRWARTSGRCSARCPESTG